MTAAAAATTTERRTTTTTTTVMMTMGTTKTATLMMIKIEVMLVSGRIEETPWDNYEARGPQQIVNYIDYPNAQP